MPETRASEKDPLSLRHSLSRLLTFQFKLAMDALRDFALSPVSILVFIIDTLRRSAPQDSLHQRLMNLGRRSDRLINLFGEYSEADHYTVDETLTEIERALFNEWLKTREGQQARGDSLGQPHR